MTSLQTWPAVVPSGLVGLFGFIAERLGLTWESAAALLVGSPAALAPGPLVLVLGNDPADGRILFELDAMLTGRTDPVVVVIGDGFIGTDGPSTTGAIVGAGAVALVRSLAVRRVAVPRINVVAVPEALLGQSAGVQHGPLRIDIDAAAIADVVAFALGDDASYVHGQVFFANGGRHIFSSLTA